MQFKGIFSVFLTKARQYRNRFASDDEPVKDRAEEVSDHEACSPDQVRFLKTLFSKFLDSLEPREQQIVLARFGFDGDKPKDIPSAWNRNGSLQRKNSSDSDSGDSKTACHGRRSQS